MSQPKRNEATLDFVLYLGDPDEGAESVVSSAAIEKFDEYKERLPFDDLYGAVCVKRDGEDVGEPTPDPIIKLLTSLVRVLPYVIDGEPETVLLNESEHGFLFEPNADKVLVSFFRGSDAFEPDEYLVEAETVDMLEFGAQLTTMGQRLLDVLKKLDGEAFEDDEYIQDLSRILDVGKEASRSYRLEKERGLR